MDTQEEKTTTEAAAVASIVRRHIKPDTITLEVPEDPDKVDVLLLPKGIEAHSIKRFIDEFRDAPERRRGTAYLESLDSFIAHAKRFKADNSALFAMREPPTLVSVLDYHPAGSDNTVAQFGTHRGAYAFPLSDEWTAWNELDGKPIAQAVFAEWIENHIFDIRSPGDKLGSLASEFLESLQTTFATPSRLLELSRGLTIREGISVTNVQNLQSGEGKMSFSSEHSDEKGQPLNIPAAFLIGIPVFRSGDPYQIPVRLRYRLAGGRVTWSFEMFGTDRVFDNAFLEACETAEDSTEMPLFMGRPE